MTSILTIDLEKAYDTIWVRGLLYKMEVMNIPRHLIKITQEYLKERTFTVTHKSEESEKVKPKAGLSQGSALSPTLFNTFINDISSTNYTQLTIFADDTAILSEGSNPTIAKKRIQTHLHKTEKFLDKWKLQANANKTQTIIFT